jgi:nucleoside-diphosphate-sugar epimerase
VTSIVLGGCGFLGRHVTNRLLGEDRRVVVVDDMSTPGADRRFSHKRLTVLRADLTGHGVFDRPEVMYSNADEVWVLASPASPAAYKARQIKTLNLGGSVLEQWLSWAAARDARVLFVSSSEVYGDTPGDLREDMPTRVHPTGPRGMYDLAKAYGEALCAAWHREEQADTRIARVFNTYGPEQLPADGRLVPALLGAALTGRAFKIHGTGQQTRTFGYVSDTVNGLFKVMRDGEPATPYNVGGSQTMSVLGIAQLVQQTVGQFPVVWSPPQDEHDPQQRRPDLSRLRALGWAPSVGLAEGILLTAEWLRRVPSSLH